MEKDEEIISAPNIIRSNSQGVKTTTKIDSTYKKSRFGPLDLAQETKGETYGRASTSKFDRSIRRTLNNMPRRFAETSRATCAPRLNDIFDELGNPTLTLKKRKRYKFGDKPHKKWADIEDIVKMQETVFDIELANGDYQHLLQNKMNLEETVELNGYLGCEKISSATGGKIKQVPLVVNLKEKKFDSEDVMIDSKIDLVCVIDVSSSMSGTRMQYVHETLLSLLDVLEGGHRIAFVIFDHEANFLMNFKKINPENEQKIRDIILSISKRGKTNIKAGIEMAMKVLGTRFSSNPTSCVFLLSDGDHNCDEFRVDRLFRNDTKITKSDYVLCSFGYGDDHDAYLLEELAKKKRGNYYYINNLRQIEECFLDCLGVFTSIFAKDVEITVKLEQNDLLKNLKISHMYGSSWHRESDGELSTVLPSFYSGFDRNFVSLVQFELKVETETEMTLKIGTIGLSITNLDNEDPKVYNFTKEIFVKILPKSYKIENGSFPITEKKIKILVDSNEAKIQLVRVKSAELMTKIDKIFNEKKYNLAIMALEKFIKTLQSMRAIRNSLVIKQVIKALKDQKEFIMKDLKGEEHKFKTSMFIVQMRHVFDSEISSPLDRSDLFSSKKQIRMRSMAIYLPEN